MTRCRTRCRFQPYIAAEECRGPEVILISDLWRTTALSSLTDCRDPDGFASGALKAGRARRGRKVMKSIFMVKGEKGRRGDERKDSPRTGTTFIDMAFWVV